MKSKEYLNTYYEFSGLASSTARPLAITGIAIIWLFSSDGGTTTYTLPQQLLFPTVLLIFSLTCDLLQYVVATIIWRYFAMKFEAEHQKDIENNEKIERDFSHSKWWELPTLSLFIIKILTVLTAYALLIKYISRNIHFT